jgi:dipeptidyl aminopeptidase/acylaminoacyl peptidase
MLLVLGADGGLELVDMTGAGNPAIKVNLQGNSRPVWVQTDSAFYVVGSDDNGATWSSWRVTASGVTTKMSPAASDLASSGSTLALIANDTDGSYHVFYLSTAGGTPTPLTDDPSFRESVPSFSPDGSAVVFGRVESRSPGVSAGIWKVGIDGTGLTNLSTDGYAPRWVP